MMKKIFGLFIIGFALASCSDSDDVDPNEQLEIRLTSDVSVATRYLQETQIVSGQDLGLFVTSAGSTTSILYNNLMITADGNGGFQSEKIYYPLGSGNNIDFYAVNPYIAGTSLTTPIAFSVKEDQSSNENYLDSDLLYASRKNVGRSNDPVKLTFSHMLSKVTFVVKNSGILSLEDLNTIEVQNVFTDVSLLLSTGELTEAGSPTTSSVKVNNVRGTTSDIISEMAAIIVPQEFNAQANKPFIMITIGDNTFYHIPTSNITFESGKSYNYTITVYNTEIRVQSEILPWDEEPNTDVTGTPGD
ncbi:MAG: fimbrillin family protein [Tannerellaceae bacterium]|nr:fimbrillin family protein [Tannerellaceae bacterium]